MNTNTQQPAQSVSRPRRVRRRPTHGDLIALINHAAHEAGSALACYYDDRQRDRAGEMDRRLRALQSLSGGAFPAGSAESMDRVGERLAQIPPTNHNQPTHTMPHPPKPETIERTDMSIHNLRRYLSDPILSPELAALKAVWAAQDAATAKERADQALRATLRHRGGWPAVALDQPTSLSAKWDSDVLTALAAVEQGGLVVIEGEQGQGKTTMAGKIALTHRSSGRAVYTTARDTRDTYILGGRDWDAAKRRLVGSPLLCVDQLSPAEATTAGSDGGGWSMICRVAAEIMRDRYDRKKPTIVITHIRGIVGQLGPDITSRFEQRGVTIALNHKNFRRP